MARCLVPDLHKELWRISGRAGNQKTILCIACEFEWNSRSKKYDRLPPLTDEEKKKHLIGKYN